MAATRYKITKIFFLLFFFISTVCYAQTLDTEWGPNFTYSRIPKGFFEAGISYSQYEGFVSEKKSLNLMYNPWTQVKGINFDYNYGAAFCFGFNIGGYVVGNKYNIGLMPKIGIGAPAMFSINYGYNFCIGNETINSIEGHNFSLNINIPCFKKKVRPSGSKSKWMFGLIRS
jgi:hypothetical protein